MGQADAVEAGEGCLPRLPGEQTGEVGGGKAQTGGQLLHGKPAAEMLLHITDALRYRSRRREKGGGFQRAKKTGKKAVNQLSALVAFQLTSLLKLPVQIQPQKDGKAVRRKRKAGAEGRPYLSKKRRAASP